MVFSFERVDIFAYEDISLRGAGLEVDMALRQEVISSCSASLLTSETDLA